MDSTLQKSTIFIQASLARVPDWGRIDSPAGAYHQPSIDPSIGGQSLYPFSPAWTNAPYLASADGGHRPTLPSGSGTPYSAATNRFPEEHRRTLPSGSESHLPSSSNFQFGSSSRHSDASSISWPSYFKDYLVPKGSQVLGQQLARPVSGLEYCVDRDSARKTSSAFPMGRDTTHLGDADHLVSQLLGDNANLNEQNDPTEPAPTTDDDLWSQLLEGYPNYPEGNAPNHPLGVASSSLQPVLKNAENHIQARSPIEDFTWPPFLPSPANGHHANKDHLMPLPLDGEGYANVGHMISQSLPLSGGHANRREENRQNYQHGGASNSPQFQNTEIHMLAHSPMTGLGPEVSTPIDADGEHAHKRDLNKDDFISQFFVDYDHLPEENKNTAHDPANSKSQEPVLQPAERPEEAHAQVIHLTSKPSSPSRSDEVHGNPSNRVLVNYDNHHTETERNTATGQVVQPVAEDKQKEDDDPGFSMALLQDLEEQIKLTSYPQSSMRPKFLERFKEKFRIEILRHFRRHKVATHDRVQINDFPAVIYSLVLRKGPPQPSIIRVMDRSSPGLETKGSEEMIEMFNQLITWLIFINTAMLRSYTSGGADLEAERTSHVLLIDWLWEEAFRPPGDGYPVMGVVPEPMLPQDGQALESRGFGRLQASLLKYLSQEPSTENCLRASISIFEAWHTRLNKELGKHLLDDGPSLIPLIQTLVLEATVSRWQADNLSRPYLNKPGIQVGNFMVPSWNNLPHLLLPAIFTSKPASLGKYEGQILTAFKKQKPLSAFESSERLAMTDLPVLLVEEPGNQNELELATHTSPTRQFTVRVVYKNKKDIRMKTLRSKMKYLFFHLQMCHRHLLHHLNLGQTKQINSAQNALSKWLSRVILQPDGATYPLVGTLETMSESPAAISSASNFNIVQKELIHYISTRKSSYMVFRLSLTLIGYWYKNSDRGGDYWTRYFQTDELYWKTMIRLLCSTPELRRTPVKI
ncbi:hypothetical protein PtA15_15A333 [Puccinia triticina]|uniref:Uncharacterized protein n=1 Tax=Puccinia triticina TaxID=208348 RepID=A0ABY7D7F6_9BASI|nr:uncharacterized protein PtA15_15A333 [Puccinia triticina]WAQ91940.1 hypothetical protein PtA15_15A333 [Puccinia triticina]